VELARGVRGEERGRRKKCCFYLVKVSRRSRGRNTQLEKRCERECPGRVTVGWVWCFVGHGEKKYQPGYSKLYCQREKKKQKRSKKTGVSVKQAMVKVKGGGGEGLIVLQTYKNR